MTCGTAPSATCVIVRGIAGRVIQKTTPAATCPAPGRMPCETTDEGLRGMTVETTLQTMYDTTFPTMYDTALRTMPEIAPGMM